MDALGHGDALEQPILREIQKRQLSGLYRKVSGNLPWLNPSVLSQAGLYRRVCRNETPIVQ